MNIILDDQTPLSQSQLWACQRRFYAAEGVSAWHNQVPFFASSNAFTAQAYADMLVAFMLDWQHRHGSTPFKMIELGSGCGQFAFLLLQALAIHPLAGEMNWHYVMSDFDDGLIDFWRSHPGFKSFVTAGQLSFLKYSAGDPLTFETGKAPLIVIANYLFDSLPTDIYHIAAEVVSPVHITSTTVDDNYQNERVIDFEKINLSFHQQTALDTLYPILEQYRLTLLNTTLLYPTAALQLLAQLQKCSKAGVLLLASDKAYVDTEELDQLEAPELTSHNGCFSMMVNFDAIARFADLNKGDALLPSTRNGIKTAVFSFGFDLKSFDRLIAASQQHIERFATSDYLNFFRQIEKNSDRYTLEDCVSLLALSNWDAEVFTRLYQSIYKQLDQADMLTVNHLLNHLSKMASQFYWMPEREDILFQIGVVFHTLKRYQDAINAYQLSLRYYPDVYGVHYNMGVCYQHLAQQELADACFARAEEVIK